VNLDRLYYIDFYSIERFGKTRIGQLLLYAKQSQDKRLIKSLSDEIHPKLLQLVKRYDVDGIVFIPPTVKREVQFMKELERNLSLPLPILKVSKIKTEISVPQKTLSKLGDRIENAKHTIVVEDNKNYKNILLIDDAVGSGATLNETAAQIKRKGLCEGKLIGLAITGSFKGFDVISEV
jgi:predicted amidophosphoribosyltransferase